MALNNFVNFCKLQNAWQKQTTHCVQHSTHFKKDLLVYQKSFQSVFIYLSVYQKSKYHLWTLVSYNHGLRCFHACFKMFHRMLKTFSLKGPNFLWCVLVVEWAFLFVMYAISKVTYNLLTIWLHFCFISP